MDTVYEFLRMKVVIIEIGAIRNQNLFTTMFWLQAMFYY
jgi:hypothetical protein